MTAIRLTAASSQYLTRTSAPLVDFNADYTFTGWIRFATVSADQIILMMVDGGDDGSHDIMSVTSGNRFRLSSRTSWSGVQTDGTSITVAAGQWYHVAVVRSGDDVMLYVDGVLEVTVTHSTAGRGTSDRQVLGAGYFGSATAFTDCRLWGWNQWNVQLDATEVATEAAAEQANAVLTTGRVSAWDFDGANRSNDDVGTADWTEVGSPTNEADPGFVVPGVDPTSSASAVFGAFGGIIGGRVSS